MTAKRLNQWVLVLISGMILALLALTFVLKQQYLLFSVLIILLSCVPFFLRFEKGEVNAEVMVVIGILAAIAALSRVPFASIPSVQPTSFVVIMAGRVFGFDTGFLVGALAAVVSNLFLGQGPWTPWQMFCWGMIGFSAGYFSRKRWMQTKFGLLLFGGGWGFLFGWIMNLWYMLGFFDTLNWKVFVTVYTASFYFDFAHALSNIFFLAMFAGAWQNILERVQRKYGLLPLDCAERLDDQRNN